MGNQSPVWWDSADATGLGSQFQQLWTLTCGGGVCAAAPLQKHTHYSSSCICWVYVGTVVLKLQRASELPEGLAKTQIARPCSRSFRFSSSENLHFYQAPKWCWCCGSWNHTLRTAAPSLHFALMVNFPSSFQFHLLPKLDLSSLIAAYWHVCFQSMWLFPDE